MRTGKEDPYFTEGIKREKVEVESLEQQIGLITSAHGLVSCLPWYF